MKKFIAFCSSLVLTLSAVSSINTGAAELDPNTYIPTLYFSAEDNDDIHILPSGRTIFINLNEVSGKSAIDGKIRLYFNDALNLTGQIVAKWVWQGNGVELTNIYTPEEAGFKNPYDNSAASYVLTAKAYPEDKLMSVAYTNVLSTPLVPTDGESSKYPLAVFDYSVDTSANAGRYAIDFKTEQPNITNLVYRLPDGGIRDIRPNGSNVQSIYIALSDRKLGDLDNNGKINSIDASAILTAYANELANKESGLSAAEIAAADVNGDGVINAMDASTILTYYAYTMANGKAELIDYINGER